MRKVAVVGVGLTECRSRRDDVTYPELAQEAVERAFASCSLSPREVDAVVLSMSPDSMIGIAHPERWVIDAVGATGKPFMRINTGGSSGISAVHAAFFHIASGVCDAVLVVGADRVGESGDSQTILNKIWDVVYERRLPLNTLTMLAFQAVRFMQKYGVTEEDMALVAVKNRRNGALNPYAHLRKPVTLEEVLNSRVIAWPIKLYDACPQSSGACALILCAEHLAEKATPTPAWIKGIGMAAETYYMGDRMGPRAEHDHAESAAMRQAVQAAYDMAGIRDPRQEIDVAELYAPFSNIELHAIQDAGLCTPGTVGQLLRDGYFDLEGEMPVNPSGGVLCTNPIAATAMIRVAEASLQVMGRAGEHQVEGASTALATGIGGDHQFIGAVVVSSRK